MRRLPLAVLFLLILKNSFAYSPLPLPLPPIRIVEDFAANQEGQFPRDFRTFPFERGNATKVYRIKSEANNLYLSAYDAEEISAQIFRKFFWKTEDYPILSWRWRAKILPRGANELDPAKNDSACGIYVVFGGYTGKVIKYIWSRVVPINTEILKKPNRSYSIVKGSGMTDHWQTVSVNVVEDYRHLFEESLHNPIGFGILTDGNATHSPAACDYDDFRLEQSRH